MRIMVIQYYIKDNYGSSVRYAKEERIQNILWSLTGHKTITDNDMTCLESLGFAFVQVKQ